jgi:hypothetical protein
MTESQDQKRLRQKAEAEAAALLVYRYLIAIKQERDHIARIIKNYDLDLNSHTGRRDAEVFWEQIKGLGLRGWVSAELAMRERKKGNSVESSTELGE